MRYVPSGDVWDNFDNTAARTDLGFAYTIPFAGGVRRVIEHLEARQGFEDSEQYPLYDRILEAWERLGTEMAGHDLDAAD